MEDKRYENFKVFYRTMFLTIRRMCAYYNLSSEEVEQECAIAYFSNPEIDEFYVAGNNKKAFSLFSLILRNTLTDFSATGKQLRGAETKDRQTYKIRRMENTYEEEYLLEDEIMNKLELERIRAEYGGECIDDIIEYYEIGADRYCKKHNVSNATARKRISRKIQSIRHSEQ